LLLPTTTYRTEAFMQAAARLGVDVTVASEEASTMTGLNPAGFVTLDFERPEHAAELVFEFAAKYPIAAVVAVDDQVAAVGAAICERLNLPSNSVEAARASRDKYRMRKLLDRAGVPQPRFRLCSFEEDLGRVVASVRFPCVVKPLSLAASQGVIRANNESELRLAINRLAAIMQQVAATRSSGTDRCDSSPHTTHRSLLATHHTPLATHQFVIEDFVSGPEVAVEGLLTRGQLRVLAIFDKPDPLEGPFFEETIYVTPSRQPADWQAAIVQVAAEACRGIGLVHGPVHAELRLAKEVRERRSKLSEPWQDSACDGQSAFRNSLSATNNSPTTHHSPLTTQSAGSPLTTHSAPYVIEVNPRSIGGLCSRVLRFGTGLSLEELIIRHGIDPEFMPPAREGQAAGVMMIPIPRGGTLRAVRGLDAAKSVASIEDVVISARQGQTLVPLPEGSLYLGFIFARAESPELVEAALRTASRQLEFQIDPRSDSQ
jgi:biotin carboxylase